MLLAWPEDDLVCSGVWAVVVARRLGARIAFDVEIDETAAAAERLFLPGRPFEWRMTMLGARLAGREHELLRAVAVGVHVDEELEADLVQAPEPEVRDFDRRVLVLWPGRPRRR